ncbi:hypothetical protein Tco_0118040 [Tanacetum coccineum]
MSALNQQTLTDPGANDRPPMLEKGNYIPWESRFRRFLDNNLKDEKQMWRSIQKGPYVRPIITDPYDTTKLMYGSEVTNHVRHSRLMDEFDKFAAKEGESLESVHERLTTLVNIMDRNNVRPISASINTNAIRTTYPGIQRAARNHDPLALIAHLNSSSQSHGHYARDCQKPRVHDAKYFKEQMLLAMKDEARSNLNAKENDFMLDNSFGNETLEELTAAAISEVIQYVLWIVDSGCSKHMTGNLKLLRNFIKKFIGIVCFGNDHFAAITRYGDYVQSNLTICHVYYVAGLGHSLFSVRQFCDGDLEVAFRSNTCFVWNLEGDDLLTGSRESNLHTISISELAASSPVCLMSKATSTKSWL